MEYVAAFFATDFFIVRAMRRCKEEKDVMMLLRAETRYMVDSETGGLHTRTSVLFFSIIFR